MKLEDLVKLVYTNFKIYIGDELVYSPFKGDFEPFMDRKVLWLDSEDDIIAIGITGGEKHEKE